MKANRSLRVSSLTVTVLLVSAACLMPPSLSAARSAAPLAAVDVAGSLVTFQPSIEYREVRVTVSGPQGFQAVESFGADETPAIELPGTDGLYKYELRFSPVLERGVRDRFEKQIASGSDAATDKLTVQRGWFTLAAGGPVPDDLVEQSAGSKARDSSINGPTQGVVLTGADGVIRNSLCVGFDCPNAPTFDDSTILMMENNTRVKFGDTSNSPFPNNDWEIEANSSSSGGASYLGFNDCGTADNDGGCTTDLVFAVESGARQSALYVESDGDIGIGTSNPVVDLHIVTGNTPTLRLDQDGSSGFTPQVWDVAGNEVNFFIRDVSSGSKLPLRIRPGAPTSAIDVQATGNVGIGTASPAARLTVVEGASGVNPLFRTINNGNQTWAVQGTAAGQAETFTMNWVHTLDDLNLTYSVGSNNFRFSFNDGNLTLAGDVITGSCPAGCGPADFVFEPDYQLMELEDLGSFIKENKHLPNIPTAAEMSGGVSLTWMQMRLLEKIEELTLYTLEQHKTIEELKTQVQELRTGQQ